MDTQISYGISLSGGGARGILQLGVLQALHENNIIPTVVAGTSMGAINGVFYAAGYTPIEIHDILKENMNSFAFSWISWLRSGFKSMTKLHELLKKYISDDNFSALKYPLYISVTNLNSGKNELINEGRLFDYVIASASIPLVYKPKIIDGIYYVDGGLTNNFPARIIQGKCDKIIGIHVNHIEHINSFPNIVSLTERIFRVGVYGNVANKIHLCDYFLDPPEARKFDTFDFDKFDEIYNIGYEQGVLLAEKIIISNSF